MRTTIRKRGRPRRSQPMSDTGTPELVMKRLHRATAESLDLLLEQGVIDVEQHWCGIHLRWLYTLRFGAPGARTVDPTHMGGAEVPADDPQWRALREAEYAAALAVLGHRLTRVLLAVVAHNERPRHHAVAEAKEGLYRLTVHWCRRPRR